MARMHNQDDGMAPHTFANELWSDVCATHNLKLESVAYITGYSTATAARWKNGVAVIPPDAWAKLAEHTKDARLIIYMLPAGWMANEIRRQPGEADACNQAGPSEPPRRTPPPSRNPKDLMPAALSAVEQLAACLKYLNAIVADGRITSDDRGAYDKFAQTKADVVGILTRVDSTLAALTIGDQR